MLMREKKKGEEQGKHTMNPERCFCKDTEKANYQDICHQTLSCLSSGGTRNAVW